MRARSIHHQDHANPVVECPIHFKVVDAGGFLQPGKQLGLRPAAFFELRGGAFWQHTWNVFQQAAAGDVGQGLDRQRRRFARVVLLQCFQHGFDIKAGRLHQCLPKWLAVQRGGRIVACAFDAFAHQTEPVGVHAAAGQTQHHVAGLDFFSGQDFGFLDRTHCKTGQIVFAFRVHARHFSGLAAYQCTAAELTALGNAADHRSGNFHIELAAGKVVEKKQRLGTLHQHVIDAHGHQVYAYGVVHIPFKGQAQFGAHAIRAADQHRLFVALGHFKQCAKAADACQHTFTHGFFGQWLDAFDQRVARVDVNAGVFVGKGGICHGEVFKRR